MTFEQLYDESPILSRSQVLRILARHECGSERVGEFDAQVGVRETYPGREVLAWLGYRG